MRHLLLGFRPTGQYTAPVTTENPTLAELRHYAVRRSIGRPTGLLEAIQALGYVQADPIRAPARAQDLILRQRVRSYRAGDLERAFPTLPIEEDDFVNYGFLSRDLHALLHSQTLREHNREMDAEVMDRVLEFVRANGPTHPRDLVAAFGRQSVENYWGGSSDAATRALDALRSHGKLRVARRDNGIKVFEVVTRETIDGEALSEEERARRLLRAVIQLYAPVAGSTLLTLTRFLGYGAPNIREFARAHLKSPDNDEYTTAKIEGVAYTWPRGEELTGEAPEKVRFLAPFDPVVWDRARFEHFHGWAYRFEAYTPPAKRLRGYYALPLLWRERVIGWANVSTAAGELVTDIGFVGERPQSKAFARELDAEIERMRTFLGLKAPPLEAMVEA